MLDPVQELEKILKEDALPEDARARLRELTSAIAERETDESGRSGESEDSIVTGPIDLGAADTVVSDMMRNHLRRDSSELAGPVGASADLETPNPDQPATSGPEAWQRDETLVFQLPDAYRWETFIARGGMGEIHLVRERDLNRRVVMKVLRADYMEDEVAVSRFIEEAQITAQLDHHGIPPVYDFGKLPDDRYFYTMKALGSRTLGRIIDEVQERFDGDLVEKVWKGWSLRRLLEVMEKVCETVAYAHRRGVIHRDLKPSNVLVGELGDVHVIDWGIARVLDTDDETVDRESAPALTSIETLRSRSPDVATMNGTIVGTASYMAPEQVRGEREEVSTAADVFSLGSLLYEVLSGRPAFTGESQLDTLMSVLDGPELEPRELPGVPVELGDICARALHREPKRRYPDAEALFERLQDWLEGRRQRGRAREKVLEAREMGPEIMRTRERARMFRVEARTTLQSLSPDASIDEKRAAWQLHSRADAEERQIARLEAEQNEILETALSLAPDFHIVHRELARHYRRRHVRAEAEGDEARAMEFEKQLRFHDVDDDFGTYLRGIGWMTLDTRPSEVRTRLYRYQEQDRALEAVFDRELGPTPMVGREMKIGTYLLELKAEGRATVRYPVEIRREQHWRHEAADRENPEPLYLPSPMEVPDGTCYVPAGWFICGDRSAGAKSLPRRRLWLDGFFMQRDPVTHREYLEFLNALVAEGRREEAERFAPRQHGGVNRQASSIAYARTGSGGFSLTSGHGEGVDWSPDWPVFLVSWHAARAYARWYSEVTGFDWRLPSEYEWEKAARGVDARTFPWGNHFDPTRCCMRDSTPGVPEPAPPGEFGADESPYGVRDLAGNIGEWCLETLACQGEGGPAGTSVSIPDVGHVDSSTDVRETDGSAERHAEEMRVYRGGAWVNEPWTCKSYHRAGLPPSARLTQVGFRLVSPLDDDR